MVYSCIGQYTAVPYRIREVGLSIYSVEELCYYIRENIFMLDPDFFNEELTGYIRSELLLPELADMLEFYMAEGKGLPELIEILFSETAYSSRQELETLCNAASMSASLKTHERHRIKGDFLMKCGRTALAVLEYSAALSSMDREEFPADAARLSHNIGVAYASMFFFDRAADYFEESWNLDPEAMDSLEQYLSAKRLALGEEGYRQFIDENSFLQDILDKVDSDFQAAMEKSIRRADFRAIQTAKKMRDAGESIAWQRRIGEVLSEWKGEYRRL